MMTDFREPLAPHRAADPGRHVDVLTSPRDARPFGYRVGGTRSGPTLVVAGYAAIAGDVYDRLLDLPTLPWLRGSLVLITLEALDITALDAEVVEAIGPVDRTLHLPFPMREDRDAAVRDGYWAVLHLCAELGMISGRGINRPS